jgi:hypothetical protein
MKVLLLIIGSLAAIYTAVALVQMIRTFATANPGSAIGGSQLAASVFPVCLGLIVAVVCFQKAFQKPK